MVSPWAAVEPAEPQGSRFLHNGPTSLYHAKRASCAANGVALRKLCRDCHFCASCHRRACGTGTWMDIQWEQGTRRQLLLCGSIGNYRYLVFDKLSLGFDPNASAASTGLVAPVI